VNHPKFFLLCLVWLLASCGGPPLSKRPVTPEDALIKLKYWELPRFTDDLDRDSLSLAIERGLRYLGKLPPDRVIYFGREGRTVLEMIDSMRFFEGIIKTVRRPDKLNRIVNANFDIFQTPPPSKRKETVLFTGYYEPELQGSREKTNVFTTPLYKRPPDLITLDLGAFHPRFKGQRIMGRLGENTFLPYYSRAEIDGGGALANTGLAFVWLADPVDVFFLQVQGSAKIRLEDGEIMHVNYAASNGRAYKSIGRYLIAEGILKPEEVNLDSIRQYLREHPEERTRILNYNKSYVFFREVPEGPIGSLSVPVTAKRSIATDNHLFPRGALAFIQTRVPVLSKKSDRIEWKEISRFVLNQDTGGAIQGPNRVDLFFGSGDEAGRTAGHMNQKGRLYFLVRKKQRSPRVSARP